MKQNFPLPGKSKKSRKEIMENQQNADAQRDRYYATIHKGIPGLAGDKIPGMTGFHYSAVTFSKFFKLMTAVTFWIQKSPNL